MDGKAAITVLRSHDELQRLWNESECQAKYTNVRFTPAPGDRGTEIHLDGVSVEEAKEALRRFKQQVEIGEVLRSEGAPAGERVEQKLKQRPAQPLTDEERRELVGT
jgi:hypothetical protein